MCNQADRSMSRIVAEPDLGSEYLQVVLFFTDRKFRDVKVLDRSKETE